MEQHNGSKESSTAEDFSPVIVNGLLIDGADILQEMQYHKAESANEAHRLAASALVVKEVMLQRAKELNLSAEAQTGETDDEALIRTLLTLEVSHPEADDASSLRYFEANQEKFKTPALIAASHILLGANPEEPEERDTTREKAEAIIKELQQSPKNFAALVKQHSDCPSKDLNGELGQLDKGQTVAEFERQVFSLPEGLCLNPIESRYGYHIVRIDKRVEGKAMPYAMVEDKIKTYLKDRVHRRSINQYITLLMGQSTVEGIDVQGADALLL
jgi:peptidyl-prolyl cis-trans isomerase C